MDMLPKFKEMPEQNLKFLESRARFGYSPETNIFRFFKKPRWSKTGSFVSKDSSFGNSALMDTVNILSGRI